MAELDRDGDVFILDLGDDENRMSNAWLDEVHAALDEVEATEGPRALVTAGRGKCYSQGLDVEFIAANRDQLKPYVISVQQLCYRMLTLSAPTVAAINGHAFGAGAFLIISHDYAVMREDRGYVCWPEAALKMIFPIGFTALNRTLMTPSTFNESMITGRRYSGPDAVAADLVDVAVSEADVLPRAIAMAAPLAQLDSVTMAANKKMLYGHLEEAVATL
jgi:enoyl-CoA hydratase/carnithine racemase